MRRLYMTCLVIYFIRRVKTQSLPSKDFLIDFCIATLCCHFGTVFIMYSFLQYRTSQTPSALVLPILGYSWNCIQTIISRTLPHLEWLIFKLMKNKSMLWLPLLCQLREGARAWYCTTQIIVRHVTAQMFNNMVRRDKYVQRGRDTWRKLRSCDIQYLKVSEFSKFSGYPSSQPVAVHSPAWTLRQSFQISHLSSGPTLSKYLTSELPV